MRILVVCAVPEEAQAVEAGRSLRHELDVLVCGVGPAAAAAATARTIAENSQMGRAYDVVVNAGICGAFRGKARIGDLLIATDSVAAELGVALPWGFQPIDELGFGTNRIGCNTVLTVAVEGVRGEILTLASITGSDGIAANLAHRYPDAIGEAMEGFGVATAAQQAGLPFAEIRGVSNYIGDREVEKWDWGAALKSLTTGIREI
ncbi:futalosine hydrolase [Glycomyces algeriensis]|uniref:Futalosine hydrolase n=1 Tax=Glycomyces algeriensis TaxID=256037 RepID=A0A9W6LEX6_9ACTN|nr:futalosine hydrolase [Glycomyces algeriensis]MDA1366319.1 futalosine hydrolase [Glycomyces algeriensis]MDR7348665.1 futalosine hydrolase [Glycomyces algeriensis]GLI41367.1 Futalosine hydrolase [Glycomyces algeriensis]